MGNNLGTVADGKARLGKNAEISRQLLAEGYIVGNHSMTHAQLSKKTGDALKTEILDNDKLLKAIDDELTGTVPRDLAPAIDIDDGGAVVGALLGLGALARRVDGPVLEQVDRVGLLTGHDLRVRVALHLPSLLVVDEVRVLGG